MFSAPKTTLYFARIGLLLNSKAAASKLIKVIFTSDKTRRNILVNFEHKVSLFRLLMFVDVLVSGPQSLKNDMASCMYVGSYLKKQEQ